MNAERRRELTKARALIVAAGDIITRVHEEEANTRKPDADVLELFETLCDHVDFASDHLSQLGAK